ncbi:serine/threonine protein phosphatase [bacterium]|nr:serine/threonine protein phosphatase [bacterium]
MQNRLIAVGDIHGEIGKLNSLLDKLDLKSDDKVIFLGDYIDRGKHSKEVIDRLIELSKNVECVFLKGNHEDMLLKTLISRKQQDIEHWLLNGGVETYDNYGDYPAIFNLHGKFLDNLKLYHIEQNYLFVHAGVNPNKDLSEQTEDDLLWIREEFLNNPHKLPYKIIFGHTPFTEPLLLNDKIGIDTGCGKSENCYLTAYDVFNDIFIPN